MTFQTPSEFIPSLFGYVSSSKMWFTNSGARRMRRSGPPGAGEDGAPIALKVVHRHLRLSRGYANWIPPERLLGVLNGVGAVLHVFQDVISGRGPVQDFSGLLAGETLIDRQAHPAAASSGVHLHE